MAQILSEVTGADVKPVSVPIEDASAEMGDAMTELFRWFNDGSCAVDIERVERQFTVVASLGSE